MPIRTSQSIAGAVLAALLFTSSAATAEPITIVDTGAPPDTLGILLANSSEAQYLAAEFSVLSPVTVTSAEGWIRLYTSTGQMSVNFYGADGPGVGSPLFSADVALGSSVPSTWRGATGLNWFLPVGTYWISFEGISYGVEATMAFPAPFPLENYAFYLSSYDDEWHSSPGADFGVRILGETAQTAVPDPGSSLLLFGIGIAGLGAWRKRWQ